MNSQLSLVILDRNESFDVSHNIIYWSIEHCVAIYVAVKLLTDGSGLDSTISTLL